MARAERGRERERGQQKNKRSKISGVHSFSKDTMRAKDVIICLSISGGIEMARKGKEGERTKRTRPSKVWCLSKSLQ